MKRVGVLMGKNKEGRFPSAYFGKPAVLAWISCMPRSKKHGKQKLAGSVSRRGEFFGSGVNNPG